MKLISLLLMTFFCSSNVRSSESGIFLKTQVIALDMELVGSRSEADSLGECAVACLYLHNTYGTCNALKYEKDNKICVKALVGRPYTKDLEPTGLRVAWASSTNYKFYPSFSIDNKGGSLEANSLFHSEDNGDRYPWLAVDLMTPHEIRGVKIMNRADCCAGERIRDIEIRVGHVAPFKMNTKGDTRYNFNALCGYFEGPATDGEVSQIPCSRPVIGRYITLQRYRRNTEPLNLRELVIDSTPAVNIALDEVYVLSTDEIEGDSQCPSSHPFAFNRGAQCCSGNREHHPSQGFDGWESKGSRGLLHFDSPVCFDSFVSCSIPPCLNYEYRRYPCYMEGFRLSTLNELTSKATGSAEECENYALSLDATGFSWWNGICYPKDGSVMPIEPSAPTGMIVAYLPCP